MENASKALLIAGAILIVLIIIGIAVAFISKTQIFTDIFSNNLSEEEIANHNAIFSVYDGQISGTQLNTLLSTAEANNAKSNIKININTPYGNIPTTDAGTIISLVDKTSIYTARIIYNGEGLIETIIISI